MDDILKYEHSQEDDYYSIIGCDEQSNVEQIMVEYKARVLRCHPDKHPDDSTKVEQFAKLQQAKETLTNPETRAKYDQWRRSGLSISYQTWRGYQDKVRTSMHWATKKSQPQLEGAQGESGPESPRRNHPSSCKPREHQPIPQNHQVWRNEEPSDMLKKFRNYEI